MSIHCGSRGLGHQVGTDFLVSLAKAASRLGIALPDRELACAPIKSPEGQQYLGAMNAAINCALANRQILTHLARRVFSHYFRQSQLETLFDVSHNTCKAERHGSTARRSCCTCIARARRAPSVRATRACPRATATSVSR